MLPRGEQRALLLLSLLLILGIVARTTVQFLPKKPSPGMKKFVTESRAIMAAIQLQDSLRKSVTPPSSAVSFTPATHINSYKDRSHLLVVNLNSADSVHLLPLPGIGPVFSGRIIRYRNLLGGFVNIGQLHEVYGLKGETIKKISNYVFIDTLKIKKMCLDSISFGELLRHPYFQLNDVKALVKYRDFAGRIDSIEELSINNLLPDSTIKKVSPYLEFGH